MALQDSQAYSSKQEGPVSITSGIGTTSSTVGKTGRGEHDRFGTAELVIVLSHFGLGVIESIQTFARGSRRAPKVVIRSEKGNYLLKRRALGKDDPFKVAFSHQVQLFLIAKQFPLPQLIGTRHDNNSMLQWNGSIYELFEYIKGINFDHSVPLTIESGKALGLFHKLLRGYVAEYEPSTVTYHAARSVEVSFNTIPRRLAKADPDNASRPEQIKQIADALHASYDTAVAQVTELGFDDWPKQILHCDWHPGNMLFVDGRVAAVIDYDSARIQPRIIDVANGALQFSILAGADDPDQWPDHIDLDRFKNFVKAYESVPGCTLSHTEIQAIPPLMIEALIAESAIPIANTGSFAGIQGYGFLRMVVRKANWMRQHADELVQAVER